MGLLGKIAAKHKIKKSRQSSGNSSGREGPKEMIGNLLHPHHESKGGRGESKNVPVAAPHSNITKWTGKEIPHVGTPLEILMFRQTQHDGHADISIDEVKGFEEVVSGVHAIVEQLFVDLYNDIMVEQGVKVAATAAHVGLMFVGGGFLNTVADEAIDVAKDTVGARATGGMVEKDILKCTQNLATFLSSHNEKMRKAANATGHSSYLAMVLCEQAVSLNEAQGKAIANEIDPANEKDCVKQKIRGDSSYEDKAANRFDVFEFCSINYGEIVEVVEPTQHLQYEIPESHLGELKVKKKNGHVKLVSSAIATVAQNVEAPFKKLSIHKQNKLAEVRNENGLPSYGDYVIRRFLCVVRVPIRHQARPLIHLPPVYTHFDPNYFDMNDVMCPHEVNLGPGDFPGAMEYNGNKKILGHTLHHSRHH